MRPLYKMNRQKTYRFFTLLLAYLAITTTLLANGRVFEVFKSEALVKKIAKPDDTSKKQKADHQENTTEASKEERRKVREANTDTDTSDEVVVQELTLEHTVPPANVNLDPALPLIHSIEFPEVEYQTFYHEPSIALLPYFTNVFNHFIVINAP